MALFNTSESDLDCLFKPDSTHEENYSTDVNGSKDEDDILKRDMFFILLLV